MIKVNVFEIKARLSEYLDRAARGDRIVIYRHNRPIAELCAVEGVRTKPRPIGPLPGRPVFKIPPTFFEPLPEDELDLWEGTEASPRDSDRTNRHARVQRRGKRRGAGKTR